MKIIIPQVDYVFDCGKDNCCSIVIENPQLLFDTVSDIFTQIQGENGVSVLSEDNKILPIEKHIELITQFIPFEMNHKNLISKISSRMQQIAVDEVHHMETRKLVGEWEQCLMKLSLDMVGNFEFPKISIESLIKASGIRVDNKYDNLGEQLLDYFELVQEYDGRKLFILVNLRSYLTEADMTLFLQNIVERGFQILMLESSEYPIITLECRHIIDADLCVLC